jgi:basic amino acid/polyamine antiporter, APA family
VNSPDSSRDTVLWEVGGRKPSAYPSPHSASPAWHVCCRHDVVRTSPAVTTKVFCAKSLSTEPLDCSHVSRNGRIHQHVRLVVPGGLRVSKPLGFFAIFSISAGAMISSGLFVLPGLAFAQAGPVVFLSYFVAGCVALTTVLSLCELITAMPKGGGDYFYVSRTFGKLFGTVSGLLSWVALSLKSAFAIVGLAELAYLAFGIDLILSGLVFAAFFTSLNLLGVRESARFQIMMVLGLIGILGAFSFVGVQDVQLERYEPFLSRGFHALLSTAGFVFVSFGGVLTTASIAGEIRNPSKNIPLGLIGSTVAVTVLYSVVTFVVVGIVPADALTESLAPIATAASGAGGRVLHAAVALASLLAFVTTANGGILTASRYPIALARDGMLPPVLARYSRKGGVPRLAVVTTGILVALSMLLDIELLIKAASTVILLTNIFAHLSVIIMRESKVANYLPSFRAPFYPWLQLFGIVVFTLLIIDMGMQPVLLSLLFVSAGVMLYFLRRGRVPTPSPALVHLIERITNRKLVSRRLAEELRDIVLDRDAIVTDDFDKAMEAAPVLEIDEELPFDRFLERLADTARRAMPYMQSEQIAVLLREREAESSTAISEFVAVPHIIIEGHNRFTVILARARKGIRFSSRRPSVKAVFLLFGSRDTRNLHLRALAAIAQVVQAPGFEERWLSARSAADLRDIVLLSARKR